MPTVCLHFDEMICRENAIVSQTGVAAVAPISTIVTPMTTSANAILRSTTLPVAILI
jgi:phosphoenolpyruvate carboxylase